jgi:hypothetical protein
MNDRFAPRVIPGQHRRQRRPSIRAARWRAKTTANQAAEQVKTVANQAMEQAKTTANRAVDRPDDGSQSRRPGGAAAADPPAQQDLARATGRAMCFIARDSASAVFDAECQRVPADRAADAGMVGYGLYLVPSWWQARLHGRPSADRSGEQFVFDNRWVHAARTHRRADWLDSKKTALHPAKRPKMHRLGAGGRWHAAAAQGP